MLLARRGGRQHRVGAALDHSKLDRLAVLMKAFGLLKLLGSSDLRFRLALVFLLLGRTSLLGQAPAKAADDLVRKTVANELKADPANFMFRCRKQTPQGAQTHLYVESKDVIAGMLVAVNDQPLNEGQQQAEEGRLDYLVHNPSELRRKQKQEREDADRITRILRALPDAFVYEYDGSDTGSGGIGAPGDQLVRLKFRPNPKYRPPSRVEQVLTGMEGILLVDAVKLRIAKIDGALFRDVSFGWGFLGHLDQGGKFQVEQGEVTDDAWQITHINLNFTGKIFVFRNLVINSNEVFSDFQKLSSSLTFAEAVELLKRQQVRPAHDAHHSGD